MKIMQIKRRVNTPNSETCTKNSTMYYCIINAMWREREREMYRVLVTRAARGTGMRQWDGGLGKAYLFESMLHCFALFVDKAIGVWKFRWIN